MLDSVRSAAHALLEALHTRVELAATEMEEQIVRLAHLAVYFALALFCLALAILLGVLLLVVLYWDSNRVAVLAILCGVFGAGAFGLALAARAVARERPRVLAATLHELSGDLEALRAAAGEKQP